MPDSEAGPGDRQVWWPSRWEGFALQARQLKLLQIAHRTPWPPGLPSTPSGRTLRPEGGEPASRACRAVRPSRHCHASRSSQLPIGAAARVWPAVPSCVTAGGYGTSSLGAASQHRGRCRCWCYRGIWWRVHAVVTQRHHAPVHEVALRLCSVQATTWWLEPPVCLQLGDKAARWRR